MRNIKELIRREIERRKNKAETMRERGAYLELLSFLDTLPDEPVTDCHELTEAAGKYADGPECSWVGTSALEQAFKAGAEWGADHLRDTTKKVSEDLKEVAENSWVDYEYREDPRGLYSSCYIDGFKAGADWQKTKMMEGAVEGVVWWLVGKNISIRVLKEACKYLEQDDLPYNVRIIILPKE